MLWRNDGCDVGHHLSASPPLLARSHLKLTFIRSLTYRYKLDTTFLHLPASEVLEKLQANLDKLRAKKDALEAEEEDIADKMKELKTLLYAKFGCEFLMYPLARVRVS